MNRIKVTSIICAGVLSLATASLLAQQSSTLGQSRSSSTAGQTYGSSSAASSTYGAQAGQNQNVRLSQLLHASVQSKDGKQLGHIRDFTVDPQSGRIEFAILSLGGAGAMGKTSTSSSSIGTSSTTTETGATGKLIPVPWQLFSQSWSSSHFNAGATGTTAMTAPKLVLNIDEAKLESAPSLQGNNWNQLQQSSFDQQVYSYFGVSRMSGTGMPGSSVSGQGTSGWKNQSGTHPYGSSSGSTQPQR